jgi:hypothetical protein
MSRVSGRLHSDGTHLSNYKTKWSTEQNVVAQYNRVFVISFRSTYAMSGICGLQNIVLQSVHMCMCTCALYTVCICMCMCTCALYTVCACVCVCVCMSSCVCVT